MRRYWNKIPRGLFAHTFHMDCQCLDRMWSSPWHRHRCHSHKTTCSCKGVSHYKKHYNLSRRKTCFVSQKNLGGGEKKSWRGELNTFQRLSMDRRWSRHEQWMAKQIDGKRPLPETPFPAMAPETNTANMTRSGKGWKNVTPFNRFLSILFFWLGFFYSQVAPREKLWAR